MVQILLFPEVTLFEHNVSTVLSPIVVKIVLVKTQPMLTPKKCMKFYHRIQTTSRNPPPPSQHLNHGFLNKWQILSLFSLPPEKSNDILFNIPSVVKSMQRWRVL